MFIRSGWITGHSYVTYGPLLNGSTSVIFEGTPFYPTNDRFWQIIAKYKASKFYTAPTAIRALMKFGEDFVDKYDLSSLKVLGTVGSLSTRRRGSGTIKTWAGDNAPSSTHTGRYERTASLTSLIHRDHPEVQI